MKIIAYYKNKNFILANTLTIPQVGDEIQINNKENQVDKKESFIVKSYKWEYDKNKDYKDTYVFKEIILYLEKKND